MLKKFVLLGCIICIVYKSLAQEEEIKTLEEITISEPRLKTPVNRQNRSVNIISSREIAALPFRTFAELLSYVQGIDIRQRGIGGAQADVNLRGGTFDQTLIMIDGIALADPQTGHHILNAPIDMNLVERIEILKGSGARTFGANAFTGAINIVTKNISNSEVGLGANYGNSNTLGLNAFLSLTNQKNNNNGLYIAGNHNGTDGYRPNADHSVQNFLLKGYTNILGQKIDAIAGTSIRKFGGSGYYAGPSTNGYAALPVDNNTEEYEEINNTFGSIKTKIEKSNTTTQLRFTARGHNDDYYFVRNSTIFNSTKSTIYTGDINSNIKSSIGSTGLGFVYQFTDFSSLKLDTTQRTTYSLFGEQKFNLGRLSINAGAMYTYYSDFKGGFYPGLDIGFQFTDYLRGYASVSRSLRIPTYIDLYFQNAGNLNNPNLKPENTINYESGLKLQHAQWNAEITYFRRSGTEIIDRVKKNSSDKWLPTNLGSLVIDGIEIFGKYNPQNNYINFISFGIHHLLNIDYKQSDEIKFSRYAADQLKTQINAALGIKLSENFNATVNSKWFKRNIAPKGYEQFYEGLLIDAKLDYSHKSLQVFAQVNNLLNKKYVESNGITMPLRWFTVGLNYRLGW